MKPKRPIIYSRKYSSSLGFTLIELLVVIAIISIIAIVVLVTLNPAQLLAESRDTNRLSDIATLTSALNLYVTDQTAANSFSLGVASDTYPSIYDPSATSTSGDQCQGLGLSSFSAATGQAWQCAASSTSRNIVGTGWIPVNFSKISAGSPIGAIPVDPTNQTSTGLFYSYNTNGSQFELTANLESSKDKSQYGQSPQTIYFPEVISGGTPTVSALYNPSGLVGYWNLDEGSGTVAYDASGNGDNGTWSGTAPYYTGGKVGSYAGYFNGGSGGTVSIGNPNVLQVVGSITVLAWINEATLAQGYTRIIANYVGGSTNAGPLHIDANPGTAGTFSCNGVGSSIFITAGTWNYIACVVTPSSIIDYGNGIVVGSTTGSFSLSYTNGWPWRIGSDGTSTAQDIFSGSIAEVRIYNRALSPEEIMALYTSEH
jgi:prepilin-type N-terminal cleavage/methylation domain-containing protein